MNANMTANASAPEADADDYYSNDHATLGDRIAAARQGAGLTQSGLAARLGVGAKVVSAWENDRTEPRANRLAMLAGMLGVSVAWLLTGQGDGVDPPAVAAAAKAAAAGAVFQFEAATPDLESADAFFGDLLGCAPQPSDGAARRFDFFGAELTARPGATASTPLIALALEWDAWNALVERVRAAGGDFAEEPGIERVGAPDQQGAFTLTAPGGERIVVRTRASNGGGEA